MDIGQGIKECQKLIDLCRKEFARFVVGQSSLFDALIMSLITGGHILLEGLPGLAKTTSAKAFAAITGLSFKRVQFTPDLLPQDITGTLVYEQTTGKFIARKGPIFANVVLADEINRAGAKVQSALLEAMQERQVTLGTATLILPKPFVVAATENPIDEDGTYALPAAERDRFLMKEVVPYPTAEEECAIAAQGNVHPVDELPQAVLDEGRVAFLQAAFAKVACDAKLVRYIVDLVRATRPNGLVDDNIEDEGLASAMFAGRSTAMLAGTAGIIRARAARLAEGAGDDADGIQRYVTVGASPRGSIALLMCAKARALIAGRAFVLPDDIKRSALAALRHRLQLSFEASSDGVSSDEVIGMVLRTVPVP